MSVNLNNADDSTPINVSAGIGNVEATNALVERFAALKNAKKICCYCNDGGCTKWQNVITHYLTDIAAKLILQHSVSCHICKQHNYT